MKFKIYKDKTGGFRWRLVAANEKTVVDSWESYAQHEDVVRAVNAIQTSIFIARIVDA